MLSPRTAKYVEARIRDGDNFDYWRWLQRVRKEEAQEKQVPATFHAAECLSFKLGDLTSTSKPRDACVNSQSVPQTKLVPMPVTVCRSDHKARGENPQDQLKRRLMKVSDAFDEFQESRVRDAVYGYLRAVFALVVDHKGRRRTKRLLRRAFQFAGLPVDKNADPFAAVIRCTCERNVDNKTVSKWARALRYAAYCKVPRTRLRTFMKRMGGVNSCADRWAQCFGRTDDENG
jgi:hypothetical protein